MTIPPRFMSELRDRLTLSEIVGRKMKLTRAGREFKGCCPFHKEKSPSFYVNDDKQFYHCFGCGAHGDAVGFLTQHDNLSFIEAVEMLAAQAGMQVPQQSPQEVEKARKEKDIYGLTDAAANFFAEQLQKPEQREAKKYLIERGMSAEMMASFRIGFAPADSQLLRKHLKAAGYTDAQMIESGVVRASDRGKEPYSFFRERIIFPVADRRGRVVAFGGRILPEHMRAPDRDGQKPPKYINSSDSPLFHKGRMLYGESHARAAAAEGQPVIVVEGYMDVMACFQAGFRGAVAPLGTALTEEQIVSLWKMISAAHKAPVLCFDGDDAGRRAASRAAERLLPMLKPDHTAVIAFLPQGQDPDSLLRAHGKTALQTVLDGAIPLVDFLWQKLTEGRRLDTPEARAGLSKALEEETARIADRTVQHYYRQALKEKLSQMFASKPAQKKQFEHPAGRGKGNWRDKVLAGPVVKVPPRARADERSARVTLLAAIINHPVIFDTVEEDLGSLQMEDPRLDALRQAILSALSGHEALDAPELRNYLNDQGFAEELAVVMAHTAPGRQTFARSGMPVDRVLEGWQETRRYLDQKAEISERRTAERGKLK